ncbi:MAG: EUO transcription factor [Chlamydiales bacterium]|nr:EUO transcription factor [Chlamydiales bacterium]MCH9619339.1 EUO transcription factor [Chlamydiales bacterium]MCH9622143.1 EUO transcription factor [Chlamydiales bacterium]
MENERQEEISSAGEERKVVSITEAARINNVTRQAIYVAIKQGKLKATKNTRWEIDLKDLEEYRENKYSRTKSMFGGELLFDNNKGYFSVNQVARELGVPAQKIYYATRTGMIKGARKGAAWVIHQEEVERYRAEYLAKKVVKTQAS